MSQSLYLFPRCNVPDSGLASHIAMPLLIPSHGRDKSRGVGRKIHSVEGLARYPECRESLFLECLRVPHDYFAGVSSRCQYDPSAVLGGRETSDTVRFRSCHLFPVFYSPHLNRVLVDGQDILAIR